MSLVLGDVTALSESDVGSGFRLILDTGTFHDFDRAQRENMARRIRRVADIDAMSRGVPSSTSGSRPMKRPYYLPASRTTSSRTTIG
jgi:hypothetical protein